MSVVFDPYHKWLGIPLRDQPPNHYRLLGIELFESDAEVISHAADQRMAHLRVFQSGKHGKISQRLLNEVATVKLCLLNAAKKAAYDEQLREKLASAPGILAAPTTTTVGPADSLGANGPASAGSNSALAEPVARVATSTATATDDDSRQMKLALEVFAAVGVLLIAICVVYNARQSRSSDNAQVAGQSNSSPVSAGDRADRGEPIANESPAVTAMPEKSPQAGLPAPRQLAPGGADVSPVPIAVTGKMPVSPNHSDFQALRVTAAPVLSFSGVGNDRGKPAPRLGKTAAKKPDGPIYLDDLQELSSGVAIGILGKHGETGYPEFESEYGPKVIFQGKKPEHSLSTYPPPKGTGYVSYVFKGEYRTLRAVAAILEVNPADAARVAAEPFFMGGPASPLTFKVIGDGKLLWESRPLARAGDSQNCNVDVEGVSLLELEVSCPDMNSYCWAAWIEPAVEK